MPIRTVLQQGPKGKKAVAFAVDCLDFARRLGLRVPDEAAFTAKELAANRSSYVELMRAYNAGEGTRMRSWNLPFLIRHSAFLTMDHAWEMQDKDLSADG